MRKLIDTISSEHDFLILLIQISEEAHLGGSLKIFPFVRGKRREGMNKTCCSMVDINGLEYTARHSQNGNARRGREHSSFVFEKKSF
jgi:hypothetical protein